MKTTHVTCDRCNAAIPGYYSIIRCSGAARDRLDGMDLCPTCVQALVDWLKPARGVPEHPAGPSLLPDVHPGDDD